MHPIYNALPSNAACDSAVYPGCLIKFGRSLIGILMPLLDEGPLSVSLWKGVGDPVFDGVGLSGFKRNANALLLT